VLTEIAGCYLIKEGVFGVACTYYTSRERERERERAISFVRNA
jgi:hypothetical protein